MSDKNLFGGAVSNFLYVPLSETEQEALSRILETESIEVVIHGWGTAEYPPGSLKHGDARLQVEISFTPSSPILVPVKELDLELRVQGGETLFRKVQEFPSTVHLGAGRTLGMIWDISIRRIDPALVKKYTGAVGLTSRLTDKDTGEETFTGNMHLGEREMLALELVRRGEARARKPS